MPVAVMPNGLSGPCLEIELPGGAIARLPGDALSGDLFVFLNRRRDRVKILVWQGDGFLIWYKRLEEGTFAMPRASGEVMALSSMQLAMLLGGIDAAATRQRKRYIHSAPQLAVTH